MDPFHVVRLAGDALDRCRRMLHTGTKLLTGRQIDRLTALFADHRHVEVEATWGIYQRMIDAYRTEDRAVGKRRCSS